MKRKKLLIVTLSIVVPIILFVVLGTVLSFNIKVNHYDIEEEYDIKIAQLSDTHFLDNFDIDDFENMILDINESEVDVIIFTGDMFQTEEIDEDLQERVTEFFNSMDAEYKIAILGNHDVRSTKKLNTTITILEDSGFTLLVNEDMEITVNDEIIHIVGLDDLMHCESSNYFESGYHMCDDIFMEVLDTTENYDYNIVLTHEPDTFDPIYLYDVDLVFAGHSHGGQVRFPFIGDIINVYGSKRYNEKYYEVDGVEMYVSFGLGESTLPVRFWNYRQAEVYTIHK